MTKSPTQMLFLSLLAMGLVLVWAGPSWAEGAGETLFKAKCAACHGPDGKGETAMGKALKVRDLGSTAVQGQSDAQLTEIVTKGKNKMPPFDGKLSKEQIGQLVAYVRELGKKH